MPISISIYYANISEELVYSVHISEEQISFLPNPFVAGRGRSSVVGFFVFVFRTPSSLPLPIFVGNRAYPLNPPLAGQGSVTSF